MKSVIVTGGLGNQMFEYAYVLALRDRGIQVKLDISYYDFFKMHNGYELERVFGINEKLVNKRGIHMYWLRVLNRFRPSLLCTVDKYVFDQEALYNPRKYIFGYWQDEEYFKSISNAIRQAFTYRSIDDTNRELASELRSINSVSLHIRRGDYKDFGMTIVDDVYYTKAIAEINKRTVNPVFYIFSDDLDASKNLAEDLGIRYKIVSLNRGVDSYKDMYLMSQCKHNIIANSSFSWWGAWLNENHEKIVIAPSIWDERYSRLRPQCRTWILV